MSKDSNSIAKVRIGFIGAGNWAEYNHILTLQAREDVELLGIATPTQKSRDRVQSNFRIPFATAHYRDLLEQPLDALVVSPHRMDSTTSTHRPP